MLLFWIRLRGVQGRVRVAPRKLPRRRREETRQLLLTAGEIVADGIVAGEVEDPASLWLRHVRFDDVLPVATRVQAYLVGTGTDLTDLDTSDPAWQAAVRAYDSRPFQPISKPAAYTVFDSEEDFREDLAAHLLRGARTSDAAALIDGASGRLAGEAPPSLSELIDELADREFARIRDLPSVFLELGAAPFLHDDRIRAALREGRRHGAEGPRGLIAAYELILSSYGRRMRPGFVVQDLYVALTSLAHGLAFHARVWPESAERPIEQQGRTRSVFAVSCEALLLSFTEPA